MPSTAMERPLIVRADRTHVYEAMRELHDRLEELSFRVAEDRDPSDEARVVSYENIAELTIVLSDLDLHLGEFQGVRKRLSEQRSYLAHAYAEQHDERRGHDDA